MCVYRPTTAKKPRSAGPSGKLGSAVTGRTLCAFARRRSVVQTHRSCFCSLHHVLRKLQFAAITGAIAVASAVNVARAGSSGAFIEVAEADVIAVQVPVKSPTLIWAALRVFLLT